MPSTKDLKKRIGSVVNTRQTTKAMKMVSAAKLRRAQDAILSNRPFAKQVGSLVEHMLGVPEITLTSNLLDRDGTTAAMEGKRLLLIIVTSDRGLCAGFNANVIKTAVRWMKENSKHYSEITLSTLGKRGNDFFRSRKQYKLGEYFDQYGGKVTFKKASDLAKHLVGGFNDGQYDEVKIIYNEFKNAVLQTPVVEDYLPLRPKPAEKATESSETMGTTIVKPNADEVLAALLQKHFSIQIFRIMLESQAGEHGARMSAMENATKNASEMIKKLTIQYNKQRQAGITKELLEIIAGSESAKAQA
ncbi:MAG: ATP synthase F1 subunit gamma [Bdellovibrionales bacterium]|nr:ATP synthase F1 subunit gamma [Bdellovibrionales bacterium]